MTTLRIEHAIHDFGTWQKAFDSFAEARTKAGVRSFAIRRPVDDPKYLMLDLEFDTASTSRSVRRLPAPARLVLAGVIPGAGRNSADPDPRPSARQGVLTASPAPAILSTGRLGDLGREQPRAQRRGKGCAG